MSRPRSAFKTPEGEAAFLAAYDAAMKLWPVPYEELDDSKPVWDDARHRQRSEGCSTLGAAARILGDIDDVGAQHRRFQQGLSGLCHRRHGSARQEHSQRADTRRGRLRGVVVGDVGRTAPRPHLPLWACRSVGGWRSITRSPHRTRVQKLVLLSPGGFLPMVRQFSLRGMLMVFFPTRVTVNSFMRWLGFTGDRMLDLFWT
mgnify:CR=1 FL=1